MTDRQASITEDPRMEVEREPTPAQVRADVEALRQERDRLRAEVSHLVEVTTVWRMELERLRAEVAGLREERRLTGTARLAIE